MKPFPGKMKAVDYLLILVVVVFVLASSVWRITGMVVDVQTPIIYPAIVTVNSNLNCSAYYYDPTSNVSVNLSFAWYQNGAINGIYNGSALNVSNNSTVYSNVSIPSVALVPGDNWTCSVMAFNGTDYSNWVNSTQAPSVIGINPLVVWDETNTTTKYYGDSVTIYANLSYNNGTNSIEDFDDNCNVSINGSAFVGMTKNSTSHLFTNVSGPYNLFGVLPYNVTCTNGAGFNGSFIITNPIPAGCGENISHSVKLNQSYNAPGGNCFTVNSSNVIVFCNGNIINGSGLGTGITVTGLGSRIRDCTLSNFVNGIVVTANSANLTNSSIYNMSGSGIYFSSSSNRVYNITVVNASYGVFIQGGSSSNVSGDVFRIGQVGVYLNSSNSNFVQYSNFSTMNYGIIVNGTSTGNQILYDNISGVISGAVFAGTTQSNTVTGNTINSTSGPGFVISSSSDSFSSNYVTNASTGMFLDGPTSGSYGTNYVTNSPSGIVLNRTSGLTFTNTIFSGIANLEINSSTGSASNIIQDTSFTNLTLSADTTNMTLINCTNTSIPNVLGGILFINYYIDLAITNNNTGSPISSLAITYYNSTGSSVKTANTNGAGFARTYLLSSIKNISGQFPQDNYTLGFKKFGYFDQNISANLSSYQVITPKMYFSVVYYGNFVAPGTDFNNLPDMTNVTNATLVSSNGFGKLAWNNPINASGQNFDVYVKVSQNNITVNSSGLDPSINSSANLTLNGLSFINPRILRDGNNCTDCSRISYSAGSLVFSVTGFSTYASEENRVNITSPANNSVLTNSFSNFSFTLFSNLYPSQSCSLYINDSPIATNSSVTNGSITKLYASQLANGSYNWYVNCSVTGNSSVFRFNVTDSTAPSISGLINTTTSSSATMNWTTNENSTSVVNFGNSSGSLNTTVSDSSQVTSHSVLLSSLFGNSTYYYNVSSCDVNGRCSFSSVNNFSTSLKADGASCTYVSECSGTFCVHGKCRSGSTYCGDGYCDNPPEDSGSCSADCSSSSGGGSGGGGSSSGPDSETQMVNGANPGTQVLFAYSNAQNPFSEITFTTENILIAPSITTSYSDSVLPSYGAPALPGVVYKYVVLDESTNLKFASISNVSFRIKIEKSWYVNNSLNVSTTMVHRFDNITKTWQNLSAVLLYENVTHYVFLIYSPGLSLFAIDAIPLSCHCTLSPSEWSVCSVGQQTRIVYKNSCDTPNKCAQAIENRDCEQPSNDTNQTNTTPTIICGDGICETGESYSSCPNDCEQNGGLPPVEVPQFDLSQYLYIFIIIIGFVGIVAGTVVFYYFKFRK